MTRLPELVEAARAEWVLPAVDGERCVHAHTAAARCRACADACPAGAWVIDDEALGIDTTRCDGCGRCVPACPEAAIDQPRPVARRRWGGERLALAVCERAGEGEATLACLHALGLRDLLAMYGEGCRHLFTRRGDCARCDRGGTAPTLEAALATLAPLLADRGLPPFVQREVVPGGLARVLAATTADDGPVVDRRGFFRHALVGSLAQAGVAEAAPEGLLPPGRLLPAGTASEGAVRWPWLPAIDARRCNGCDACLRLCPHGALQLAEGAYRVSPADCTGCGLCVDACDRRAVRLTPLGRGAPHDLPLRQARCRACGAPFHWPAAQAAYETLCPICRQTNHHRHLFQVFDP